MKNNNCRGALGALLVVATFVSFAPSAFAQEQPMDYAAPGGAYSDFDLGSTAAYVPRGRVVNNSNYPSADYGQTPAMVQRGIYNRDSQSTAPLRATTHVRGNASPQLAKAGFHRFDKRFTFGQLPPTRLDSFVLNSGDPESVYGDEGGDGPPEMAYFMPQNTIEMGIMTGDQTTAGGLTTAHHGAPYMWNNP